MKICLISREYPPETHYGGTGTYSFNMAHALVTMGHTVHILTATKGDSFSYDEWGVMVHRLSESKLAPREIRYATRSLQVLRKIETLGLDFDVVQAVEWMAEGLFYSFSGQSPLVTRLATPLFLVDWIAGNTRQIRRGSIVDLMERTQTKRSKGIVSSTKALANNVSAAWNLPIDRIEVIPNSIDLTRMRLLGELPSELENLAGEYLVYFGRLEGRKGVHLIAQALPAVMEKFPNFKMVFIGKDIGTKTSSMRSYVEQSLGQFSERAIFIDSLPQERLFPIVARAKLVLLPSLWEAFGFVAIEAMSLNKAVIATSGSGFEEIIENELSGILVPPGNIDALAEAITRCLQDVAMVENIETEAGRRVMEFDVNNVAGRLCTFYADLLWKENEVYASSGTEPTRK